MSKENLKLIYKQNQQKEVDFVTPLIVILVVLSIFGYLYATIQKKLMHISWSEQKCNTKYLFFSGFLNPLNKNPWKTTQDNFQKCVSSNIYKDPALTRAIKQNHKNIKLNHNEMKNHIGVAKENIRRKKEVSDKIDEDMQDAIFKVSTENSSIFEKDGLVYNQVLLQTTQLFHTIASIIRYIQGILLYNVSNYKISLNVDQTHNTFMTKYDTIYRTYSRAYSELSQANYRGSINTARDAIEQYNQLNQELEDFMNAHYKEIGYITEGCYQLQYNMEDNKCYDIFPQLNPHFIDFYPMVKDAMNTTNTS